MSIDLKFPTCSICARKARLAKKNSATAVIAECLNCHNIGPVSMSDGWQRLDIYQAKAKAWMHLARYDHELPRLAAPDGKVLIEGEVLRLLLETLEN